MSSSLARDQTVPRPAEPPSARPAQRDAFFDNAKFLAIVLVVIGHSWEPLRSGSHSVRSAYMFVYSFHMPVMIVTAGYMARNFDAQPRRIKRLITGIVVPYLVFECAYRLYDNGLNGHHHGFDVLDPWWLTWFLMSMFAWRLTAPIWRTVRWPVTIALIISFLASLKDLPATLEMNRTLELLPFFVVGMVLKRKHFAVLHRRNVRIAAAVVLAAALATAFVASEFGNVQEFFFWRSGREHFSDLTFEQWFALRVGTTVGAAVATAAFLALVPRRRTWFTVLGEGTLYTYLLHGFLLKAIDFAGVYDLPELHKPFGVVTLTLLAAVLATALCTPPVRRVFKFAMEPELRWLFRRDTRAEQRSRVPQPSAQPHEVEATGPTGGS